MRYTRSEGFQSIFRGFWRRYMNVFWGFRKFSGARGFQGVFGRISGRFRGFSFDGVTEAFPEIQEILFFVTEDLRLLQWFSEPF